MSDKKNKISESFKIPTGDKGKIGGGSAPIDAGIDIPIQITESVTGEDKNKNKDVRLTFSQVGELGKVAREYIGFKFDKGFNSYLSFLYYGGVMKKAGIDPNSQPTPTKLLKSIEKGVKVLNGAKYLADISHKEEKYQGKERIVAEIISIRKFENGEPVVTTDSEKEPDGFEGYDEAKPAGETTTEKTTEDVTEEVFETSDDDYVTED